MRLPPGAIWLCALLGFDVGVIVGLAVYWPIGILYLAAGTVIVLELIAAGARKLFG